ncbi:hypothetical protein [Mesorhizobium sp. B2-3-10]|uniref:hypothetical protein n=1 Tax=Mesorhizobium sp. B2-3-10 TaxID=2589954 RepID=UPI00112BACBE|nr:hypothetical protein [Mesorhizobium sp. B2-3-10]TPL98310.1 hypothetical protein FJ943_15510 [Mesorhizobium sp. B2-3-10]
MYITEHAYLRAAQRLGWTRQQLTKALPIAMKRGHPRDYGYVYNEVFFVLNAARDTLKTIILA